MLRLNGVLSVRLFAAWIFGTAILVTGAGCGWIPGMGKTQDADLASYSSSQYQGDSSLFPTLADSEPVSFYRMTAPEFREILSRVFQSAHGLAYNGTYWGPSQHSGEAIYKNFENNLKLFKPGNNATSPFLYKALDDYMLENCHNLAGFPGYWGSVRENFIFPEASLTAAERAIPDVALRKALSGTRSLWRSRAYTSTHPAVEALAELYRGFLRLGGEENEAVANKLLCMGLVLAPQFQLGSPDGTGPLSRISIKIANRPPHVAEVAEYFASTDRSKFLGAYLRKLREEVGVFGKNAGVTTKDNAGVIAELGGHNAENSEFYLRGTPYRDFINNLFIDWLELKGAPVISADNDFYTTIWQYIIGSAHVARSIRMFAIPFGPSLASTDVQNTSEELIIPNGIKTKDGNILKNPLAVEMGARSFSNSTRLSYYGPDGSNFDQSEPCDEEAQAYEQDFDAETTAFAIEEQRIGGQWEFVVAYCDDGPNGNCAANLAVRGRLLSTFDPTRVRPIAQFSESQIRARWYPELNAWQQWEAIPGAPFAPFQNRPIIRYGRNYTAMTGFSAIRHMPTGARVFTCNSTSRFLLACAYRPTSHPTDGAGKKIGVVASYYWYPGGKVLPNALRMVASAPAGRGWTGLSQDSILNPDILSQMRCGKVDLVALQAAKTQAQIEAAFPRGSPGNYNEWMAYNNWDDFETLSYDGAKFSNDHWQKLLSMSYGSFSESDEIYNFLWHLVRKNRSMKELLTADYRIMNGPHQMSHVSRARMVPGILPGIPHPDSPGYHGLRVVPEKDLAPMSQNFFRHSLGGVTPNALGENVLYYALSTNFDGPQHGNNGEEFGGLPVAGVLTQAKFVGQYNSIRQVSAEILQKFTCRTVNNIPVRNPALAQEFIFDDPANGSKHSHMDPQCYTCHRTVDPMAAALSHNFQVNGAPGGNMNYPFGISGDRAISSDGSVLSKRVRGIKEVAKALADSDEFASCLVQKAFVALHGREATRYDEGALRTITERFKGHYRFEKLLEDIVEDPSFVGLK